MHEHGRYFTKEEAKRQIKSLGWFLYYTGACEVYLDYQVWNVRMRKWHPFTWVLFTITAVLHGATNSSEILTEMFPPKGTKGCRYRDIRKNKGVSE